MCGPSCAVCFQASNWRLKVSRQSGVLLDSAPRSLISSLLCFPLPFQLHGVLPFHWVLLGIFKFHLSNSPQNQHLTGTYLYQTVSWVPHSQRLYCLDTMVLILWVCLLINSKELMHGLEFYFSRNIWALSSASIFHTFWLFLYFCTLE